MRAKEISSPSGAAAPFSGLLGRRDLLRVGSLGVAASIMPGLEETGAAARLPEPTGRAKSVIYLWMGGGVPHLETFDPKPEAPEEIRGTLSDTATNVPGIRFNEACPQLAKVASELAVIRSYSHDSNDHLLSQVYTLSGRKVTRGQLFSEPNLGAIVSYLYGPRNGLPGYIAVPGITRPGPPPHNLFVGGWLGDQYAPFCVGGQPAQPDFTKGPNLPNPSVEWEEDLNPSELAFPEEVTIGRLQERASLREQLDSSLKRAERNGVLRSMEGHFQGALNLLTSDRVRSAFDISEETPAIRERYGRTKIGGRCLLARRLVEAGARYVMVDYGYDPDYGNLWDNHNAASQNFPHTSKLALRGYHVAGMDRAFAGLISDLRERGLLDSTLVVFLTEFGRTPKINSRGGRDHWGACGSLFFAGAGTRGGQVVGASDEQDGWPVTRSYGPADIAATILQTIGVRLDETRLYGPDSRPHPVLDHGNPITEIL